MLQTKSIPILLLFYITLYADPTGYFELGGMAFSQKSNTKPMLFHTEKILTQLDGSPSAQKEIDPYLSFQYINKIHDVLLTTTLDEEDKLSLRAEGETFGSEIFIRPSYEFKNPYDLYVKRATTLVVETGAGAIYKIPLKNTSSLEFAYTFSKKNVSDDELGRQLPSLQRDGYINRAECIWTNDFFKLTLGAFATQNMGNAENHKGSDIQIASVYTLDKIQIQVTTTAAHTQYDDINPMFNVARRQNNLKASLSLEYDYSKDGYYSIIGMATDHQFSNIDFYNESTNSLFIGIGRNF